MKRGEAIQWIRGLVRILKERQFSEEVRAIHWTAGLWKVKSCCPHPLPKNQLLMNQYRIVILLAFELSESSPIPLAGFLRREIYWVDPHQAIAFVWIHSFSRLGSSWCGSRPLWFIFCLIATRVVQVSRHPREGQRGSRGGCSALMFRFLPPAGCPFNRLLVCDGWRCEYTFL